MVLVLKSGETWTDPFGTVHDVAMACPYEVTGNGCRKYEVIKVGVWLDIASRNAGNIAWKDYYFYIDGAGYTTYFSIAVLNQLNVNPYD